MDQTPTTPQDDEHARFVQTKQMIAEAKKQGGTPVAALQPLSVKLHGEFVRFAADRQPVEERWLKDLRQFLGIYEPEVMANLKNRSKAFKRKTRSKIRSVDSRMFDLLFPASAERNFRVESTPEPTIADEDRAGIIQSLQEPTENQLRDAIRKFVGESAKRMESTIDDQLTEGRYRRIARQVLHSGNLYGTGVLKGPLVERRLSRVRYIYSAQEKRFVMSREEEFKPFIDFCPVWRWYPDMAVTELDQARAAWERHLMSKQGLLTLAKSRVVDGPRVRQYVQSLPGGLVKRQNFEQTLHGIGDTQNTNFSQTGQYELLERWGWLDRDDLAACGVKLPTQDDDIYFGNILMFPNGEPIKAVLQPMDGQDWPYHLYYFDKNESSIFGEGLATIMRGDQEMLNSATRAMLDNAAITAGPQIEAYVNLLSPTEKVDEIYPFKVWARTSGDAQYPAIRAINIDSHITELRQIAQEFDASADETTAIPKFMDTGVNPTQGAAGTASGASMMLGQANIALKDQVAAWDEGITKPFVAGMYSWNMQFNPDKTIHGDYDVKALGASSLVAKEVRSQQLGQYAATAAPEERPFIKWHDFAEQRAQANELVGIIKSKEEVDQDNNSDEAKHQAELTKRTQELQVATLEKNVAVLAAKVAQMNADTIEKRAATTYAALQAGGVATTSPAAAAAGDEILKSIGALDVTPQETTTTAMMEGPAAPAAQPSNSPQPELASLPSPASPANPGTVASPQSLVPDMKTGGAFAGQHAGIETTRIPG